MIRAPCILLSAEQGDLIFPLQESTSQFSGGILGMKSILWRQPLLLCLALITLVSVSCSVKPPRGSIVDDLGREVNISSVPQRIVSLAPSNTEILFALGLADKIVAVTDMCDYPAEARAKPKLGGFEPNLEQIVAFGPDLVLAIGGYPDLVSQLESKGLIVIALQPKDLQGILTDIELVGQITGTETRASELVGDARQRIDSVVERVKGTPRRRVFFELDASADSSTPWTAGPGSFAHALIELAGGENVAQDAPAPWVQFSAEEIVRSDPQVIILADARYGVTPDIVTKRPG